MHLPFTWFMCVRAATHSLMRANTEATHVTHGHCGGGRSSGKQGSNYVSGDGKARASRFGGTTANMEHTRRHRWHEAKGFVRAVLPRDSHVSTLLLCGTLKILHPHHCPVVEDLFWPCTARAYPRVAYLPFDEAAAAE